MGNFILLVQAQTNLNRPRICSFFAMRLWTRAAIGSQLVRNSDGTALSDTAWICQRNDTQD